MLRALIIGLALLLAPLASAGESTPVDPIIVIKTSEGDITLRLFPEKSPVTVKNFLDYVDSGFYKGTIFHRVIPDMMIQGGGFTPDLEQKEAGDTIPNESRNRLHNVRGTVAMARLNDPDSASAQFFINVRNNLYLDWSPGRDGYTVFGEVIDGMKVVDYITTAPTHSVGKLEDVPVEPITILDVTRQ